MKASEIKLWPEYFTENDWPEGVLENLDSHVLTDCVFPLRRGSGIPMWPSAYAPAHVRFDGNEDNQHYAVGRLSQATDMHCKTYRNMIALMVDAEKNEHIGGVGIYFDTNTPMIHVDRYETRGKKLTWMRTANKKYIYKENNPVIFYKELANQLNLKGVQ
jgi:hypothetical protein